MDLINCEGEIWYSDVHQWGAKQNLVPFFVNYCVFVALPREGSGRVWRQEELLAFPRNLLDPPHALLPTHINLQKKEVARFCLARLLWT